MSTKTKELTMEKTLREFVSMESTGQQFIAGYIAGRLSLKDEKSRSEIIKDAINKKST